MSPLIENLRQRKLVQWLVAYLAASWVVLQVLGFLAQTFAWPQLVLRAATVLLIAGVLVVLILGWYHGEKGQQDFTRTEILLLSVATIIALSAAAYVVRTDPGAVGDSKASDGIDAANSIAVLPFANLSQNPEAEYFSDGITEELLNLLAEVPGLRVVARTSSFALKGKELSVPEAARRLGVTHVVEGTVQRSGSQVRIHARLIDGRSAAQLWSKRFDRELKDVFAVEEEIGRAIADALRMRLTAPATVATNSPEAHELYLRGRFQWNKLSEDGFRRSIEYYQQAIARDSSYADAYAGLAESYLWLTPWQPPTELIPRVRAAARKAVALDERSADAHAVLGAVALWYDRDLSESERHLRRALELNPNAGRVRDYYSWTLFARGQDAEGVRVMQEAVKSDPLSAQSSYALEFRYLFVRKYDEVIRQEAVRREIDPDEFFWDCTACIAYREKGDFNRAVAEYEAIKQRWKRPLHGLAITYARMGRAADAQKELQALLELQKREYLPPEQIALVYANLNQPDEALRWLQRAIDQRSGWQVVWPDKDPSYDPLRANARFQEMRRKVNAKLN